MDIRSPYIIPKQASTSYQPNHVRAMRTIRFPFALASGAATITATLDAESYEVHEATSPHGQTLLVTPDDLNAIEAYLDAKPFVVTRSYEVAETTALDVMNGETASFIICHDRGEGEGEADGAHGSYVVGLVGGASLFRYYVR